MAIWTNSAQAYSWVAKCFHWVTAFSVIGLFFLGLWMSDLSYGHTWYHKAPLWHMSIGVLLFVLVVLRIAYRLSVTYPDPIATHTRKIVIVSKVVHICFYVLIVSVIVMGYVLETAGGKGVAVFDWFELPAILPTSDGFEELALEIHELLAKILVYAAGVHGLIALKHHFYDKDATLRRMLTKAKA